MFHVFILGRLFHAQHTIFFSNIIQSFLNGPPVQIFNMMETYNSETVKPKNLDKNYENDFKQGQHNNIKNYGENGTWCGLEDR